MLPAAGRAAPGEPRRAPAVAESLARDGALAVDPATATDVLWTLVHPDVHQLLVAKQGWSSEAYERWLADTLPRLLLAGRVSRADEGSRVRSPR